MIADINKYIEFLTENKITEHQFLILWLVHTKDENNIRKYKNTFKQFNVVEVEDLIERGWIDDFGTIKDNKIEFNIYNYVVTDRYVKNFIVDEFDAYDELVQVYPKWLIVKGVKWPTVKGDPSKLAAIYHRYHKGNKLAHDKVLDITKRYFANHPPIGKLEDYIYNKQWNLLEDELSVKNDAFKIL